MADVTLRLPGCDGAIVSLAAAVVSWLSTVAVTVLLASRVPAVVECAHLEGVLAVVTVIDPSAKCHRRAIRSR